MGLRAPSLADMDAFEVSRKRKPVKPSNARSVNVILWRVDGSAVVAHSRRATDCCTLWRRMMCARNVCRNNPQSSSRDTEDADVELGSLDHDFLGLGESRQAAPLMKEAGSNKLQSAFNMRRWPQGWI